MTNDDQRQDDGRTSSEAELDRVTSMRLRRLRSIPVDTTSLEAKLRAELPDAFGGGRRHYHLPITLTRARAVAATLLVLASVAAVLITSASGPALASPNQMAAVHEDLVSGRDRIVAVDSIEAANEALKKGFSGSPDVPHIPHDHVMACCMRSIKDKRLACVLVKYGGTLVTMSVAKASDMKLPKGPTLKKGSVTYYPQTSGNLNMVMAERNDRWVCIVGELPAEALTELAEGLRF